MSDRLESAGQVPMTTMEVDCAVSAKGDVNVSWRVKVQVPSAVVTEVDGGQLSTNALSRALERLSENAQVIAARAKRDYPKAIAVGDALDERPVIDAIYHSQPE